MEYKNKYIRCRFCDSGISAEGMTLKPREKKSFEQDIKHEKVYFICPACGYSNESFVFDITEDQTGPATG